MSDVAAPVSNGFRSDGLIVSPRSGSAIPANAETAARARAAKVAKKERAHREALAAGTGAAHWGEGVYKLALAQVEKALGGDTRAANYVMTHAGLVRDRDTSGTVAGPGGVTISISAAEARELLDRLAEAMSTRTQTIVIPPENGM